MLLITQVTFLGMIKIQIKPFYGSTVKKDYIAILVKEMTAHFFNLNLYRILMKK